MEEEGKGRAWRMRRSSLGSLVLVLRLREEDEEEEEPHMSPWAAGTVLVVTTILVSICADYLVDSIDALVERAHISRNFIGLILIPIVGNAAEHVTAVVVAVKNKMDLVRS